MVVKTDSRADDDQSKKKIEKLRLSHEVFETAFVMAFNAERGNRENKNV